MVKIGEFKLNKFNSFIINTISIAAFFLALTVYVYSVNGNILNELIYKVYQRDTAISIIVLLLATVVIHELVHAIGYKIFGARLKFGIRYLNVYTVDISGRLYSVLQMSMIMLLPFITITTTFLLIVMLLPHITIYMLPAILLNICGSTGDIFLLIYILYKGGKCKIKDEEYGFSIYLN